MYRFKGHHCDARGTAFLNVGFLILAEDEEHAIKQLNESGLKDRLNDHYRKKYPNYCVEYIEQISPTLFVL